MFFLGWTKDLLKMSYGVQALHSSSYVYWIFEVSFSEIYGSTVT